MAIFSISSTNDITKINNKKNRVVIPTDIPTDILIKNRLYLEDLYKYLHVYTISSGVLCAEYVEVILEIESAIDNAFISQMLNYISCVPIMYPDGTQLPGDSNYTIPGYEVVYTYSFSYDKSFLDIYTNIDDPNTIKIKAEHNIPILLTRIVSKLSGEIPPPSSLNKYIGGNNLVDMTLPEFIELYTTYFNNELSYDSEGTPYIMSILDIYSFLATLLNFKVLTTFDITIPSNRSQSDKNIVKSLAWELEDLSFDNVYIVNKKVVPIITNVSTDIENIKYKNNFILEKSEDGIVWYPVLGIPYTSEKAVNGEAINISLSNMKTLPTDTVITNVSARYITIDTPTDYMTPTNVDKYLYLSSIFVYDDAGAKIPFVISNKHFTNARKNGVMLSDTELATLLVSDDINSCVKLETTDTVSLTLDLGSTKNIAKILVRVGDTSGVDVTKYKYNVNYGASLDNMSIAYTYEDTLEPPGQITVTVPETSIIIKDPWISVYGNR